MAESRVVELRRRLERDPASRLFAQLAEEHRRAGDHAEAIRVARAGLAQHPVYPSARLTLGRALLETGDAAGARVELEQALRQAPDNILASRFLGEALEALGELDAAARQYAATLAMTPADEPLAARLQAVRARLAPAAPPEPPPPTLRILPAPAEPRPPAPTTEGDAPLELQMIDDDLFAPVAAEPVAPRPPAAAVPPVALASEPLALCSLDEDAPASDEGAGTAPFSSSTLAELYLSQGLHAEAVEVYRNVIAADPANERARLRLAEIEARFGPALPASEAVGPVADPKAARRHAIERTIGSLEALLAAIGSRR